MIEPNIDLIHYKPSVQHVLRFSFCIPAWDLCVYQLCPTEIAYWAKNTLLSLPRPHTEWLAL